MITTAKITSKGQVTIPRYFRQKLNSEIIEFEFSDSNSDEIIIRPVKSVAGTLKKYAKQYIPLNKIRTKIQKEIANEKK